MLRLDVAVLYIQNVRVVKKYLSFAYIHIFQMMFSKKVFIHITSICGLLLMFICMWILWQHTYHIFLFGKYRIQLSTLDYQMQCIKQKL